MAQSALSAALVALLDGQPNATPGADPRYAVHGAPLGTKSKDVLLGTRLNELAVLQTSAGAGEVGITDAGGYFALTHVEGALQELGIAQETNVIADPGDAAAIPVTASGICAMTSGGAETRTLADPSFLGQVLTLCMDTDGGDIVITAATGVNQAGNTSLTFADAGDHLELKAISEGGALIWRIVANDGVALA